MAPKSAGRSDADDDEEDDVEEERPSPERAHRPSHPPKHKPRGRPPPVRAWKLEATTEEEEEAEGVPMERGLFGRKHPRVYWRARDAWWFEPLVALAILILLLVSLYAYTQNWPPVYVVESESMQHGTNDVVGLLNTGDLVLVKQEPATSIVTYVEGEHSGYSTYGEYGDVILYEPDGSAATPIIHRAILYLSWNPTNSTYNATALAGLPCGAAPDAVYQSAGTPNDCGVEGLDSTLTLHYVGWQSVTVSWDLSLPLMGRHSGFLTMGDNNFIPGTPNIGEPDQTGASSQHSEIVEPGWIVGVARGMVPWFGSLKLLLEGNAAEVPPQSWEFLALTIVGLIVAAFAVHYALRGTGYEGSVRREEERQRDRRREDEGERPRRVTKFILSLNPFHRGDEEEEEDEADASRSQRPPRSSRHGRPRPDIRRAHPKKPRHPDDEEEL